MYSVARNKMDKANKTKEIEKRTELTDAVEEEKHSVEDITRTFSSVGLAPWMIKNLKEVGIEKPTQI